MPEFLYGIDPSRLRTDRNEVCKPAAELQKRTRVNHPNNPPQGQPRDRPVAKYSKDIPIRVAVIESNPIELEYLLSLVAGTPGVTLSGDYSDLVFALPELEKDPPDMVIADLDASNGQAATSLKQLRKALPHTSVLLLSTEKDRDQLFQALEAGVSGWLQKPCTADQIVRAILILHEGGAVLSNPVARKILDYFRARGSTVQSLRACLKKTIETRCGRFGVPPLGGFCAPPPKGGTPNRIFKQALSGREREILGLLGHGMEAASIATKLGLSGATVRTHVRNMLVKLKVSSRAEAVAKYLNPPA
jgi:DNA-binding NarL/FixJ family response regulator